MQFFKPSVKMISDHLKIVFQKYRSKDITGYIIVGELSSYKMISASVRKVLKGCRVICPDDAELAVLQGGVLYGHSKKTDSRRACKYTYGTSTYRYSLENDDLSKKLTIEKVSFCKDAFNKLAENNTAYCIGYCVCLPKPDVTKVSVDLYKSTEENPKYVTDRGCSKIGKMVVNLPDASGDKQDKVSISLVFGRS